MMVGIIFDLYGTLLHIEHVARSFHELARRAAQQNRSPYRSAIEHALTSNNPTLAAYAAKIGLEPQADLALLQTQLDEDIRRIQPFDDAIRTLKELKRHGIKTAVISNLATPYKQPFADHHLDDLVDVTVFSCDCGKKKPDPAIYQLAAKQLACDTSEIVMVGDSFRADVEGPSQVGISGIHVVREGQSSPAAIEITSLDSVLETCQRMKP